MKRQITRQEEEEPEPKKACVPNRIGFNMTDWSYCCTCGDVLHNRYKQCRCLDINQTPDFSNPNEVMNFFNVARLPNLYTTLGMPKRMQNSIISHFMGSGDLAKVCHVIQKTLTETYPLSMELMNRIHSYYGVLFTPCCKALDKN